MDRREASAFYTYMQSKMRKAREALPKKEFKRIGITVPAHMARDLVEHAKGLREAHSKALLLDTETRLAKEWQAMSQGDKSVWYD